MLKAKVMLLTALSALSAPALAEDESAGGPVDVLLACRDIAVAQARLSCQDEALATLAGALESGRIEVIDREAEARTSALQRFSGVFRREAETPAAPAEREEVLENGAVAVFDSSGDVEEMRGLAVARVTTDRFDTLTIYLENGEVWRQAENRFISAPREADMDGLTATIERGVFGARFMELSHNGRRFPVRRVD